MRVREIVAEPLGINRQLSAHEVKNRVAEILERVGPDLKHGQNPQDGRPAEMRVVDPWGNNFDLSARGYFGREEERLPAVRQLVVQADRPDEVADFYKAKLDLIEEGRAAALLAYMAVADITGLALA